MLNNDVLTSLKLFFNTKKYKNMINYLHGTRTFYIVDILYYLI